MLPPSIGRGKDKAAARPARKTCAVQAALFSLTVELSGARSDGERFGLRENPRHRTHGVPHDQLARPAFSATVTVPLRLRWRAARRPAEPPGDPTAVGARGPLALPGFHRARQTCATGARRPRWRRGTVPSGERIAVTDSCPAPRHPKTPAPHGFAVSAVRAGGPVLVPSRGGARSYAFPFLFPFPQTVSAVAELGPTRGTRRSGEAVLDILQRRAWADARSAAVKSAGFRRLRKQTAAGAPRLGENQNLITVHPNFPNGVLPEFRIMWLTAIYRELYNPNNGDSRNSQ